LFACQSIVRLGTAFSVVTLEAMHAPFDDVDMATLLGMICFVMLEQCGLSHVGLSEHQTHVAWLS